MATNPFDSLPDVNTTGTDKASSTSLNVSALPEPLKPYAKDFEDAGNKYGIDPNFLAAVSWNETGGGTSKAFRQGNNAMGISNASGPLYGFNSVGESIDRQASTLAKPTGPYRGASTIQEIGSIYSPPGAGNDPYNTNSEWPSAVASFYNKLTGKSSDTPVVNSNKANKVTTSNPFDSLPDISESSNPFDKLPDNSSQAGEQTGKVINLPAATPQELAKAGTQGYPSSTPNQQPPKPSQLTSGLSAGIEGTIGLLSGLGAVAGGEAIGLPVTGGASLLAVPALFTAGSALGVVGAKKAEKLLGLEPEIQASQQEYPKTAFAGQVIPQLPFAAESALGYGATALTKGAGAVAGQMAGQAAIGAGIMEPMRYGVDVTLNKMGITDQPAAPITFGSTGEQVLTALALGGKATGLAPSKDPIVNEKTAQVLNGAESQTATPPEAESKPINLPPATPEELAKVGEAAITETPVDNTQKLIDLATDQLEHKPGSSKHTAIQKQIDALKQPAETPVAEAQLEIPNESVQIKKAGEVGVRNAPAVGEGVGEENKSEVPAQASKEAKEEVGPEAAADTQVQAKEEPKKEEKVTLEPSLDQMAKHDLAYVNPESLKLSQDVPNFKEGSDPVTGIVAGEELKGKYDPEAAGIVHIWERLNGDREVISGRHRWQLALANKVPEILIKIHREADGFTKEDALVKDAQLNIKDEKGSVKDFAAYFRNDPITKEDAQQGGLLSRSKQKNGFSIGRYSEDDLYGLFRAGKISEAKAAAIAESAPNDSALQRAAIGASKGLSAEELPGYIALLKEKTGGNEEQTNLFGEDESFIKEAMRISKEASARANELSEQIRAVQGAARNPEAASKLGVDVKDPQGLQKRISELKEQRDKYSKFWLHDDIKSELGIKKQVLPTIETNGEGNLFGEKEMPFGLVGETESTPQEVEPKREDKLTGSFDFGEPSPTNKSNIETWADDTIKESKKRLNVGLDPEVLSAYAVKGAFKIARGVRDFTAWSKEMLSEFGEAIRPHLDDLWNRANQIHNEEQITKYGPKPPSEREDYTERLTNQLTKVLGRKPTDQEVSAQVEKKFGKAEAPAPVTVTGGGGEGEKISLKNQSAEAETKALGLPELTQQDEQEMNAAMDRAKATSAEDPLAGQRLAESLIADPKRSLTGDESALLLKHKTDLFNGLNKMAEGLTEGSPNQKFEKGLAYDNASKSYRDLLQAIKDRGSEWGREGRWRQALLSQDYTFATQERLATAAKRKPLTSNEKTKLAEETKRLTEIDKQIAENQEKEANKQEQRKAEQELKNAPQFDPYIQSLVDRITKNVSSAADAARERIRQRRAEGRLFTGVDPTDLADHAIIGADYLLKGTTKFADWSSKMIGEFGEKIRPYLDDIFKKSKEFNEQQIDKESKGSKSVKKSIVKASSPEERIRKGQETRARNRLEELKQEEERQKNGDFSKPVKKAPIEPSKETKALRIEAQKIKDRIDKRKAAFEKANRPFVNKVLDAISALNRFNILSHVTVLEHLAGAAVENIATRPVSSTLSQVFRFNKTLNAIRKKAIYEGGLSAKSELKGVFGIVTSAKDVWSKLLKGKADIDWLYGGKNNDSPSFVRAVENIHGAMKEPVRQGIFSRSLQLRIEAAEKQGLDPTHDEVLYHTLASEAVNDANSDIFMGDNFITRGIRGLIKGYETNKQSPRLGKFVSTLLDIAMPIMNVPTNIAIRKMRLALGLLEAPIRIGIAAKEGKLANGAETLTTQEAEQIMRAFKYGAVGLAVGAYAWTHSNQFGGIINNVGPNAPENKDLKKGEMQLGGIKIPRPLGHGPVATFMNMVADARRMYDKSVRNNPNNKWSSLSEPAFFSMFVSGLGSMPPAQAATRFFSPFTTAGQKLGQTVRDMIIPGAVQDVAAKMDTASQPKNFIDMLESEPIKRSPKTFEQEIMKGIPGLRNQLPTPKGRSSRSSSILPGFTESKSSTFGSF